MSRFWLPPMLLLLALATSGCTSTKVLKPETAGAFDPASAKVLLLPLDVELSELAAGGVVSPRADWTSAAREHLQKAIEGRIAKSKASHVLADSALLSPESPHLQLFKLHEAIGTSIYQYQAGGPNGQLQVIPTLKFGFDWTLGESVQALRDETGANYALFVHVRDSYATAGRKAAMVGSLVVCGVTGFCMPIGTGVRSAFASLVDLNTGQVVWFNRSYSETGDLREA
ncbi:MAG TPA: hypothetical protein VFT98_12130, partial [Myxococcota bacterium]|nr:hypothetical protein [Myxococcota bacterium]